jgi:hypothetical protein
MPSITWLQHLLPDRLKSALMIAVTSLHSGKSSMVPSYNFLSSKPLPGVTKMREFRFKSSHSILSTVSEISISSPSADTTKSFVASQLGLLPPQLQILDHMLMDHTIGQHICLLGPKVLFALCLSSYGCRGAGNLLSPENFLEWLAIHWPMSSHCTKSSLQEIFSSEE